MSNLFNVDKELCTPNRASRVDRLHWPGWPGRVMSWTVSVSTRSFAIYITKAFLILRASEFELSGMYLFDIRLTQI